MKKSNFSAGFNTGLMRSLIISLGVICGVVFVSFTAVSFLNYRKASTELRRSQGYLEELEADISRLKVLLAKYGLEREKFSELLFKERDIPAFLDEISKFSKSANVKINDLATRPFVRVKYYEDVTQGLSAIQQAALEGKGSEDEGPVLMSLPIQISVDGDFKSIVNFLWYLEQYKQLLTLGDVEIKVNPGGYPVLESNFVINVYSLKELDELAKK